eukprot:TRINITY_DN2124_c0_g1_i1.p1 TRINITY_DN2124_c0_g1~~TRINITY_DN2124_c0_g1_i1.p1  ORF type:complete len:610 (-),score=182.19 TRINITY_DN2124_c0_g1_i1:34-1863(-)
MEGYQGEDGEEENNEELNRLIDIFGFLCHQIVKVVMSKIENEDGYTTIFELRTSMDPFELHVIWNRFFGEEDGGELKELHLSSLIKKLPENLKNIALDSIEMECMTSGDYQKKLWREVIQLNESEELKRENTFQESLFELPVEDGTGIAFRCVSFPPYLLELLKDKLFFELAIYSFFNNKIRVILDEESTIEEDFQLSEKHEQPSESSSEEECNLCKNTLDDFMIACDSCDSWFHGRCSGVDRERALKIKSFFCDNCRVNKAKKKKKIGEMLENHFHSDYSSKETSGSDFGSWTLINCDFGPHLMRKNSSLGVIILEEGIPSYSKVSLSALEALKEFDFKSWGLILDENFERNNNYPPIFLSTCVIKRSHNSIRNVMMIINLKKDSKNVKQIVKHSIKSNLSFLKEKDLPEQLIPLPLNEESNAKSAPTVIHSLARIQASKEISSSIASIIMRSNNEDFQRRSVELLGLDDFTGGNVLDTIQNRIEKLILNSVKASKPKKKLNDTNPLAETKTKRKKKSAVQDSKKEEGLKGESKLFEEINEETRKREEEILSLPSLISSLPKEYKRDTELGEEEIESDPRGEFENESKKQKTGINDRCQINFLINREL